MANVKIHWLPTHVILLFLLPFSHTEEDAFYYITPTHEAPSCPTGFRCLTLSEYVQLAEENVSVNTTLEFLPGNHTLESIILVEDATTFRMIATYGRATSTIVCNFGIAGFYFLNSSQVEISGLGFSSCGTSIGVVYISSVTNFELSDCIFQDNHNTAIWLASSYGTISNSMFVNNSAEMDGGGVCVTALSYVTFTGNNHFERNSATGSGGGISSDCSIVEVEDSVTFRRNQAGSSGGGINLEDGSVLSICGNSVFEGNLVQVLGFSFDLPTGGGISAQNSVINISGSTVFDGNIVSINIPLFNLAAQGGGLYASDGSIASFDGTTTFVNNQLGAVWVQGSSVNFSGNTTFLANSGIAGGAVQAQLSATVVFAGTTIFKNNQASLQGGAMIVNFGSMVSTTGEVTFESNTAAFSGGAIQTISSNLSFSGKNTFLQNTAQVGSAINAQFTSVELFGNNTFIANLIQNGSGAGTVNVVFGTFTTEGYTNFTSNAAGWGGGLYLVSTNATLQGTNVFDNNVAQSQAGGGIFSIGGGLVLMGENSFSNNKAATQGGAIHFVNANLLLAGEINITDNAASRGGGISLEYRSVIELVGPLAAHFRNNSADLGGAIYVGDILSSIDCAEYEGIPPSNLQEVQPQCFFSVHNPATVRLIFVDNLARESGSALYGGLLDRCNDDNSGFSFFPLSPTTLFLEISEFIDDSENQTISSEALRVCFCQEGMPNCSYIPDAIQKSPGQALSISIAALDQLRDPIPATMRAQFLSESAGLGQFQGFQRITAGQCKDLQYTLFSLQDSVDLILYADGPCGSTGTASRSLHIEFLPCPDAFQLSNLTRDCICTERLQPFEASCDVDSNTILRSGDFWMKPQYENGTYQGLILQHHCPFDYCVTDPVEFQLNDTDVQCAFNRSDFLCGSCAQGFSLTLGSSRCLECSNIYLLLMLVFMAAGIGLVFLLLLCKLTVSKGTINGLIFYANIVQANRSIFVPSKDTNILTVFISWVNLDLGIETCFYDGLDAYTKTWLQFVFPVYVWTLIGIMIILSRFSSTIAKLLGTNPISVLATLFLLSYAKILRTIITAFSYTSLEYPDNSTVTVWLYDGNIAYLQGKHIPLFLVSLVALLFFLPYTMLLLLGEWLLAMSNMKLFKWVNSPRVKIFLDAYYGPFNTKQYYWTGLLLLLRCILFLVFAFNVLGNPSINLLAISSATLGMATVFISPLYKSWYLNILEASMILNLGVLAAATYHVKVAGGNQSAATYTSISVAFLTFIGILIFHIYLQLKGTKICQWITKCNTVEVTTPESAEAEKLNKSVQGSSNRPPDVTTTYVELRELLLDEL